MSKPKTIDLTKLTPEERCRVMVDTVDSRYPTKNYKLNQPDVETTTTNSLIDQQAIVDFKRNNTELYPYKYGEIKIEPNVITYNGKIYIAIDSLNPTLEECIKEWEEKGWKFDEDGYFSTITFIKGDRGIEFDIEEKSYFTFQPRPDHNSFDIDIEFHTLIHKTLKALEVTNNVKN